MLGLPGYTILGRQKQHFDGISLRVVTISKRVLGMFLSRSIPVLGKVLGKNILDFPLLGYLLVLDRLLALSTYLSFLVVSPPTF